MPNRKMVFFLLIFFVGVVTGVVALEIAALGLWVSALVCVFGWVVCWALVKFDILI